MEVESFRVETVVASCQGEASRVEAFRAALERDGCAVVDARGLAEYCAGVRAVGALSDVFFDDAATVDSFAPLREPEPSPFHAAPMPYGSWRSPHGAFLDTRLRRRGRQEEEAPGRGQDEGSYAAALEVLPRGLDERTPGAAAAVAAAQLAAFDLGVRLLEAACPDADAALLVDSPSNLPEGAASASVLRVASYAPSKSSSSSSSSRALESVAFEAHTDGAWLTLVPCARVPGLEVRLPNGRGWRCPERDLARPGEGTLLVLVGDGLNYLSNGRYPPAVHRVLRPTADGPRRTSQPFLLRASSRFIHQVRSNGTNTTTMAPP